MPPGMMMISSIFSLLASSAAVFASSTGGNLINVTDIDFVNTNVEKVCLLAAINGAIDLTQRLDNGSTMNHVVTISENPSTNGSYCNREFSSLLKLGFERNTVEMKFTRTATKKEKQTTYCFKCNYGTWNLSSLAIVVELEGYIIRGCSTVESLKKHTLAMSEVGVSRSFKCDESDGVISIPLRITKVAYSTNGYAVSGEVWTANVTFKSVQLQPFMVFSHGKSKVLKFADPYLCREVRSSHALIIGLPLVYFIVFIVFHRIRDVYGCPPSCKAREKDTDLTKAFEIEESTNVMTDDYETCHLAPLDSTCPYS